ncbi:MAG: HAMP domain-containing protein [Clostridiales bacterium]|nr:HAMP domain-containing protein [Clostridiales bacterium]
MKTFAFKNRMFLNYAALMILLVMGFVILLEGVFTHMNRDQEIYQQRKIVLGDAVEIASLLDSMDALAQQVCSSNEFVNYFIPLSEDGDRGNYFEKNLLDSIRASSRLATVNSAFSSAARISVYNDSGDYISTGRMFETPECIRAALSDDARYASLQSAVSANAEGVYVSAPHGDTWSDNENASVISLYRQLTPAYGSMNYGIVEIQQDAKMLTALKSFRQDDLSQTAVYDREGMCVMGAIGGADIHEVFDEIRAGREEDGVYLFRGKGYTVISADVGSYGWQLVRYFHNSALDAPYIRVYVLLALGGIVLLVLMLAVVYMLADKISRPLHRLSESVSRVNLNNMQLAALPETDSASREIIALDSAFRNVLGKLNQAIGLEMKAYMHALQSQMNPHFLYNMLSAITETADEDGSMHTVAMCEKLSRMLRYAADYGGGEPVTLLEEVTHARNYLDLMKERYEDHFMFEIDMDPQVENVRVPKIVLQPLVENSFQHGFKNVRPPWMVRMSIYADGENWRVRVEDNGAGTTEEELESIHRKIEAYKRNFVDHYDQLRIGGMGLVSTVVRLSLQLGEEAYFRVGVREEGGMYVVIGGKI